MQICMGLNDSINQGATMDQAVHLDALYRHENNKAAH